MYFGVIMLGIIVLLLAAVSLIGASTFRKLTKSISERSLELPKAAELNQQVTELRSWLLKSNRKKKEELETEMFYIDPDYGKDWQLELSNKIRLVEEALQNYETQLEICQTDDPRSTEKARETVFVKKFKNRLANIGLIQEEGNVLDPIRRETQVARLDHEVGELQNLVSQIPNFMQERLAIFAKNARKDYHAWITWSVVFSGAAIGIIAVILLRFRKRIIRPLESLVEGSRQVAGGNYDYRIDLNTDDEVAELGDALNEMTANFQGIKRDLNRQVQQRTKDVVRSEKMASVGFLAAGVAHEINNPLATSAWSAESLESRLHDILNPVAGTTQETIDSEIEDMKKYLRRIQDEAFRCKGITAGLLDFSRMGDAIKSETNLSTVIESVIEMVKPLSKYRGRNIAFHADPSIVSIVNEQEMKQVALNLITNALGSVEESGTVEIELARVDGKAELRVTDNGCGMTEEVQKHLFEPFFTRRRDGQGTGLGLSITYQIIEEHGGRISAYSAGPGLGSVFIVSLPLAENKIKQFAKSAA